MKAPDNSALDTDTTDLSEYRASGVDIEEGYRAVDLIKRQAARTTTAGVLNGIGSFAALYELGSYRNPVLVSGTDGVGTKLAIAIGLRRYDTVGIDCVAMCVNDVLCHGAKPLFFLDYIACGKLEATVAAELVKGVADGCLEAGCALVGGETAEMPGFYPEGEYDIAGFAVGIVEKDGIIDGTGIIEGDVLVGIASSGPHSNGYSLLRKLYADWSEPCRCPGPDQGRPMGEVLLTPTRIYVRPVLDLVKRVRIKGMAHITGGGFIENIPRLFKEPLTAIVRRGSWPVPPLFEDIASRGIGETQLFNTFNMGIGFVLCMAASDADAAISGLAASGLAAWKIGHVEDRRSAKADLCLE